VCTSLQLHGVSETGLTSSGVSGGWILLSWPLYVRNVMRINKYTLDNGQCPTEYSLINEPLSQTFRESSRTVWCSGDATDLYLGAAILAYLLYFEKIE
jgi:hypothetical protein